MFSLTAHVWRRGYFAQLCAQGHVWHKKVTVKGKPGTFGFLGGSQEREASLFKKPAPFR